MALRDSRVLHQTVADRRARLNGYVEGLHCRREPFGLSVFEARTRLLGLQQRFGGAADTAIRLHGQQLAALDGATFRRLTEELEEFTGLGGLTLTPEESAWAGATVTSAEQAQAVFEGVGRLRQQTLPGARALLGRVLAQTGLRPPASLAEWRQALALLDGVAATLQVFAQEVFAGPTAEMVAACASRSWRRQHSTWPGATDKWGQRRRLRTTARALWRGRQSRAVSSCWTRVGRRGATAHVGGGLRGRRPAQAATGPRLAPRACTASSGWNCERWAPSCRR